METDFYKHKFFIISESFPNPPTSIPYEKNPFDEVLSNFLEDYRKNIYKSKLTLNHTIDTWHD